MKNKEIWRLIPLLETSGKIQMAIDTWLLQQHRQNNHPSTLRFYTWSPVAISLGYHQHQYPEFWHDLTWEDQPIDIVRRPTGGRAVLHQGDLTYMLVTSNISGKRSEVYQKLCQFLIQGWRSLGIDLQYGKVGRGYIHNPSCFSSATNADLITTQGSKLIGSAQLIKGKAILQHGSIILSPEPNLYTKVFAKPPTIAPIKLENNQSISTIIESLIEAACDCFNIDFEVKPLSPSEWKSILN